MATFRTVELTGTDYLDTLYAGKAWTANTITYSFPRTLAELGDTSDYIADGLWAEGTDAAAAFQAASAAAQDAVAAALRLYASFTNLKFTEAAAGAGDLRVYSFQAEENTTARVVAFPGQTEGMADGDVEFGRMLRDGIGDPGQYSWITLVHELGHALGLKHPHGVAPLPGGGPAEGAPNYDSIEYTIMSYRSHVGAPLGGYTLREGSYPVGPMMNDIAALQHLYGANYTTNAGDTVYTFDPAAPTIFQAIWDGGGTDTYNFSNYNNGLSIDLQPGRWVNLNKQLAQLDLNILATGNIANAWLHDGDKRSLIENAVGGRGNDLLVGNEAANVLTGGLGDDTLAGGAGADVFVCDARGADFIGDFAPGDIIRLARPVSAYAAGDGTDVAAYACEYVTEFGSTKLYVDLDGVTGADMTIQFYGDGARLEVRGTDLLDSGPPQLEAPVLVGGDGDIYTNDSTPTVSGTGAVAGATVIVTDGFDEVGRTTADDAGKWSLTTNLLAEGTHELTATQTVGGKVSDASLPLVLLVDTVVPTATVTDIALSDDSGISATDGITNIATQTVTATLSEALADGDLVQGSLDGTHWIDLTDKVAGTTLTWADVTLGTGPLRIRVTDAAGNLAAGATKTLDYVLDTAAPTDIRLAGGSVYAGSAAGTAAGRLAAGDGGGTGPFAYALVDSGDARSADNDGFEIDGSVLKAKDATTWTPGTKSIYVRVTDAAGNSHDEALTVAVVTRPAPDPEPQPETTTTTEIVDGVPVRHDTTVYPDGSTTLTVTVPVVAAGADIPLVRDTAGDALLTTQVPAGYGLVASGAVAPQPAGAAAGVLATLLQQHGGSGVAADAAAYVGSLGADAALLVHAITPTLSGSAGAPLALTGGAGQVALVIDGRGLPAGTQLQLDNVQVATLVGNVAVTGGTGSQHIWGDGGAQTIVLGEGDDELHGGAGNDVVGSAAGNDRIFGDDGDDTVFGGAGDDTIEGGSGNDVLALAGTGRAGYALRVADGALVVTQQGGAEGSDTVRGVEALRFAASDTSAAGTVERLYEALLHRAADPLGMEFWLAEHAAGRSLQGIAAALLGSSEGMAVQGQSTDDAYVAGLYQQVLGRAGSAAEIAGWTQGLTAGAFDRAGAALAFADSAEKLAQPATLDLAHSDIAAIARLYEMVLGRAADEAGLNFWIAADEGGIALSSIADAFVGSAEAGTLYAGADDAAFVAQLYATGLQRGATSAELAQWTTLLGNGTLDRGAVALAVSETAEHIALVGVAGLPGMG